MRLKCSIFNFSYFIPVITLHFSTRSCPYCALLHSPSPAGCRTRHYFCFLPSLLIFLEAKCARSSAEYKSVVVFWNVGLFDDPTVDCLCIFGETVWDSSSPSVENELHVCTVNMKRQPTTLGKRRISQKILSSTLPLISEGNNIHATRRLGCTSTLHKHCR